MHYVQFAAKKQRADLYVILALWHELITEWHPEVIDPMRATMRRGHVKESLSAYLHSQDWPHVERKYAEKACRFETVLRVASGALDTMHATSQFFTRAENATWFEALDRRTVNGETVPMSVGLTNAAIDVWNASAAAREAALVAARALLDADLISQGIAIALLPCSETAAGTRQMPLEHAGTPPRAALQADANRAMYLQTLVRHIHEQSWQPVYRQKPFGAPVRGWDERLKAYFWPLPVNGYEQTCLDMHSIHERARLLALALTGNGGWSEAEGVLAVQLANDIFTWGGVPQAPDTVTPSTVEHVFQAALANDAGATANMNSGWTKVAAFATAHLEQDGTGLPQVIWDSRVATAIIGRLDALPASDATPAGLFPEIGVVTGRGGTRPRALTQRWPSGYGRWSSQVAGSALVRELRDILNGGGYPLMPMPGARQGAWTTRGVEMVLFMDGY